MNQQLAAVRGGDQTVTPSQVMATEIAENSIHANTRENLAELAEGTGGALLPDTLDLREPLRRAMEDVRTHYELSYSPKNLVPDGSFRRIEVKVSRPGATVEPWPVGTGAGAPRSGVTLATGRAAWRVGHCRSNAVSMER